MEEPITLRSRKLAIVLLDIIGSTAFVQKVGAVKAAQWFQYHDRLARNLCYRFDGREIDRSDGFLLSFERTIDAVNFALVYQANVPQRTKLGCRIGIHWGDIIEVEQKEIFVASGAKRIELEGLSKNIAARTMSLCQAGQVLLTKDAMKVVRNRTNTFTPKGTRYVCVGMYQFKGVSGGVEIYAVGTTIESLQPPKGSDKVKRLGGPKYIKSKARDRKLKEWFWWILYRLSFISFIYIMCLLWPFLTNESARHLLPISQWWFYPFDLIQGLFDFIKETSTYLLKDLGVLK
jgi:class 3 adenylate cyclase